MENVLISACLLGFACKYCGGSNKLTEQQLAALRDRFRLIPVCPETAGGLPTPRDPSERLGDKVITPCVPEGFVSSWAQYSILLKSPEERAAVQKALKEQDVPSMLYYPRGIHQQGAYRDMGLSDGDYPNTIEATRRVLALPMHPYLTEEDVRFITGIIRRCV